MTFLVVDCLSAYNAILGQPTLNSWKAVISTYHLMIKFPTDYGVGELRGNQVAARECYVAMMEMDDQLQAISIEEHRTTTEPVEKLEEVFLDDSNHKQTTKIGTIASLPKAHGFSEKQSRCICLDPRGHAWNRSLVIVHRMNVSPSFPPIRQKKRVFAPERDQAIAEEVRKLQEASFIREVYYPDWLANVVMVKKASGK